MFVNEVASLLAESASRLKIKCSLEKTVSCYFVTCIVVLTQLVSLLSEDRSIGSVWVLDRKFS